MDKLKNHYFVAIPYTFLKYPYTAITNQTESEPFMKIPANPNTVKNCNEARRTNIVIFGVYSMDSPKSM